MTELLSIKSHSKTKLYVLRLDLERPGSVIVSLESRKTPKRLQRPTKVGRMTPKPCFPDKNCTSQIHRVGARTLRALKNKHPKFKINSITD